MPGNGSLKGIMCATQTKSSHAVILLLIDTVCAIIYEYAIYQGLLDVF